MIVYVATFVSQVLIHTPIWVWLLLAFLVSRGMAALSPRDVAPNRMLILPLIFLVWGLTGLIGSRGLSVDLLVFGAAFIVGVYGGVALGAVGPAPRLRPETGGLAMPGSPIPLALILISFALKYIGTVALAVEADASAHATIASGMTLIGGAFAGLFWGRTFVLFRRALAGAGERSDLAAVGRLVWPRVAVDLDPEAS